MTEREIREVSKKKELLRVAQKRTAFDDGHDGYMIPEGMNSVPFLLIRVLSAVRQEALAFNHPISLNSKTFQPYQNVVIISNRALPVESPDVWLRPLSLLSIVSKFSFKPPIGVILNTLAQ
ncbi:hypothetical protein O181_094733 [Austropuccinia psidii MF-1]|uniref:Uncharacterized protein n=1 Tax=Austropuccinia psidii MF-1 TaxID=1389203 RepID=A0A9Q3PAI8_9BASI|nr:hypothetical protein [Austropuccinia psidii MF-1]